ncbi:hypothetical protein [Candidatus Foliamicus sp.]
MKSDNWAIMGAEVAIFALNIAAMTVLTLSTSNRLDWLEASVNSRLDSIDRRLDCFKVELVHLRNDVGTLAERVSHIEGRLAIDRAGGRAAP